MQSDHGMWWVSYEHDWVNILWYGRCCPDFTKKKVVYFTKKVVENSKNKKNIRRNTFEWVVLSALFHDNREKTNYLALAIKYLELTYSYMRSSVTPQMIFVGKNVHTEWWKLKSYTSVICNRCSRCFFYFTLNFHFAIITNKPLWTQLICLGHLLSFWKTLAFTDITL